MTTVTSLGTANATSGSSIGITVGTAVPAGQAVIVVAAKNNNLSGSSSCSDTRGNTYIAKTFVGSGNSRKSCIWVCEALTTALQVGDTITPTFTGTTSGYIIAGAASLDNPNGFDVDAGGAVITSGTTTPSIASGAIAQAIEAAFSYTLVSVGQADTFTESSGFSSISSVNSGAGTDALHFSWGLTSTTAGITVQPTLGTSRTTVEMNVVTFKIITAVTYNQSCLAASSPSAALGKSDARASLLSSSLLASSTRAMGAIRLGSSAPIISLSNAMAVAKKASTSPPASVIHTPTKLAGASTTPTKSALRSIGAIRQATTTPTKSAIRAIGAVRTRITFPVARLGFAISAKRQASSSPIAALVRSAGKLIQAASSPVASAAEKLAKLSANQASSSPVASIIHQGSPLLRALANVVARNIPVGSPSLSASTSPVASRTQLPTSVHPINQHPLPFLTAGKYVPLFASTAPAKSLVRAMAKTLQRRTPNIGSPKRIGSVAETGSASTLSIKTTADIPAGSIVVIIAVQDVGAFVSASDPVGNGYLGTDNGVNAGLYSTVFYATAATALNAGAVITLFSSAPSTTRQATTIVIPVADPIMGIDTHGQFVSGTGTTPNTATPSLNFIGEALIGYEINPTPGIGYAPSPGFTTLDDNEGTFGLHVEYQAVSELGPYTFSPTLGSSQAFGINVISFQTGWAPTASLAKSYASAWQALAAAVALLNNQWVSAFQAASSPLASLARSAGPFFQAVAAAIASLVNSAGSVRQAQAGAVASERDATGKQVQASSSPVASIVAIKVFLAFLQAASSPLARLASALTKGPRASTAPVANVNTSTATRQPAASSPVAQISNSAGAVRRASTAPVASIVALIIFAKALQAQAQAIASHIVSAAKIALVSSSPVSSASRQGSRTLQGQTAPVAKNTPTASPFTRAVTAPLASLTRQMARLVQALAANIAVDVKRAQPTSRQTTSHPIAALLASPLKSVFAPVITHPLASLTTFLQWFPRRMARFISGRRF